MTTEELVIKLVYMIAFILVFGGAAVVGLRGDDNARR